MALWFYQHSPEEADPAEQLVANALSRLPDNWRIRWGFFYRNDPEGVDREGDFIVQGPDGHLCVIEVKGTQLRQFVLTGHWDHGDGAKHPLEQLAAEKKAVFDLCREGAAGAPLPWIHGALALPNAPLLPSDQVGGELSPADVITNRDLEDFPAWWATHIGTRQQRCDDPVKLFHSALAPGMQPEQVRIFLKRTDQIFNRFKSQEFELLNMLSGNQQLVVEGGPGTGKTFMALRVAERLAQENGGRNVIFLCYNLLLGATLRALVTKLRLTRGSVTVMTWEELTSDLLSAGGMVHEVPDELAAKRAYYEIELPGLLLEILQDGGSAKKFDALIVDEAQDLDTDFPAELKDAPELGWWHILFSLLRNGTRSPMAIFFDEAQRMDYRTGPFSITRLIDALSQPAHVRLRRTVRYTRQINQYLQTLRAPQTERILEQFAPHPQSPVGPEVKLIAASTGTAEAIAEVVKEWRRLGLCSADDILILGRRRNLADSSIGDTSEIAGYPVEQYSADQRQNGQLAYLGVHAAKGLDALAVILIDFPDFATSRAANDRFETTSHFLGASRARQLLAVVQATPTVQ